MTSWRDGVRKDYEELKTRFRTASPADFQNGDWFSELAKWILENYSRTVDAKYIRRAYPGASPPNQARKAIILAARYNGVAGGLSAAAVTALELSSLGPQAMVTVPAIGTAIMADVAFSTRTQMRATYDLSVIHGAPLALDDVEDCYLVFLTALGVKVQEMVGGVGKAVGPQVVRYNVRRLLRTGLRKGLQEALKRIGGTQLARRLTERAMMRVLVPGINVAISSGMNYYFTKQVLGVANRQMMRRGAVVQPVLRLYKRAPDLAKTAAVKVFISVADCGDPEGWGEGQLDGLRHCQSALSLTDADMAELESYFDRRLDEVLAELPAMAPEAFDDLASLATVAAALHANPVYDDAFSEAVSKVAERGSRQIAPTEARKHVERLRTKLA